MGKADELKSKVTIPNGGEEQVSEAVHSRIKSRYKSGRRGPRDTKISALIPRSLYEEIRLLARAKNRSVGDMINEFLEDQVEANRKKIDALRELEESEDRGIT